MAVAEYAAACERLGNTFDEVHSLDGYFSSGFGALEDALVELKGWSPPEELQKFHRARVEGTEAVVDALGDAGFPELMQDLETAYEEEDPFKMLALLWEISKLEDMMSQLEDELSQFDHEVDRAQEELSPATRRILEEAECL